MYTLIYYGLESELRLKAANLTVKQLRKRIETIKKTNTTKAKSQKLRIAYISPDFREHAVGLLIHRIFENHDRSKFEVFAYALTNSNDIFQSNIFKGVDCYKNVSKLGNKDLMAEILNDNIDVLIDLAGYSRFSRPEIFTQRLAKVQLQFLGYSDTMGVGLHDYIIADKVLITEEEKKYYGEKVVYIEHNFCSSELPIDYDFCAPFLSHLSEDTFVFTCFNATHKIEPGVLKAWAEILNKCEDSILLLASTNSVTIANLRKAFAVYGISEHRIIFSERLPINQYLGVLNKADLFLDTWVYTAGSTAVCATLASLPLLTLKGVSNASRMGASINHSIKMEELVCENEAEYIQKAIDVYHNRSKLIELKNKISKQREMSSAFNSQQFVKSLEQVYFKVLE